MNYKNSNYSLINKNGQRKYLNQNERKQFYTVARQQTTEIKLFCFMLFWTGARISEVLSLQKESIDFNESIVTIKSLKKRKDGIFRQVPIPPLYLNQLRTFIKRGVKTKIWTFSRRTASRHIKRVMYTAEITGSQACSKGLRHSFAIHCLVHNIPITLIKKWLGHSSLSTTSIYLDVALEEELKLARRIWCSDIQNVT